MNYVPDIYKDDPKRKANLIYRLENANVYSSDDDYHFIDYLDPVQEYSFNDSCKESLYEDEFMYIEKQLQSNQARFENQLELIKKSVGSLRGIKILDIGCGGGLFLNLAEKQGAEVVGIEVSDSRIEFAKRKYGLNVVKKPIEDKYWINNYYEYFDVVTLWDVIEHVNYPVSTLSSATKVLKKEGVIALDTPCRDSFYYGFGHLTYKLSNGKYPTFLNSIYSNHQFGHKQIFTTMQVKKIIDNLGFEISEIRKIHELSFPYEYYLKKMMRSDFLVKAFIPAINIFFKVFPIRNKVIAVGKKRLT